MKTLKLLTLLLMMALLVSCAHTPRYAEPNLPQDGLAVLECAVPVWIVALDGQNVSTSVFNDRTRVRISPGIHTVEVAYKRTTMRSGSAAPPIKGAVLDASAVSSWMHEPDRVTTFSLQNVTLNFDAKPGNTYVVQNGRISNRWNPKIGEFTPPGNGATNSQRAGLPAQ